ncbi:MAG TPA: hypothetical protein VKA60_15775 [Blastocatellia bacterium]|nr:hypothetical protein [Blastocatellia bacterium]
MAVSFSKDILPMFTEADIQHMQGMGVQLDSYDYMSDPASGSILDCGPYADHGNANAVYAALNGSCQPQMPMGGPYWNNDQLQLFQQWMTDGYQP